MKLHAIPLALGVAVATGCASRTASVRTEAPSDALYLDELLPDPWERFNRRVHAFNTRVDRRVLRPVALAYDSTVPEPARMSVSRLFSNLRLPVTALNQALQGRPRDAAQSLGRFAVNTTVGLVGLFDPASRAGLPESDGEDLGQTLAHWGWEDSRYLVLPLLGPATVRDALGTVASMPVSPLRRVDSVTTAMALRGLEVIEARAVLLPMDEARRDAHDEYVLVRDVWAQRRRHHIHRKESPGSP